MWISRFLRYAGFIVFLNKQDLLKDKINAGNNIGQYFPQYYTYSVDPEDGDNNDTYIRTRCFIRDLFHVSTSSKFCMSPSNLLTFLQQWFLFHSSQLTLHHPQHHAKLPHPPSGFRRITNIKSHPETIENCSFISQRPRIPIT